MGTTFWLLPNNEQIYTHMARGPLGYVGTLVCSRIGFDGVDCFTYMLLWPPSMMRF